MQSQVCSSLTNFSFLICFIRAVSKSIPYCTAHQSQMQKQPAIQPTTTAPGSTAPTSSKCQAHNKKGNPCGGHAIPQFNYCKDHIAKYANTQMTAESISFEPIETSYPHTQSNDSALASATTAPPPPTPPTADIPAPTDNKESESAGSDEDKSSLDSDSEVSDIGEDDARPTDNMDEAEEPEHLQHLRDVYTVDEVDEEEEVLYQDDALSDEEQEESAKQEESAASHHVWVPPNCWNWEMNLDARWKSIQELVDIDGKIIALIKPVLVNKAQNTKRAYYEAKVRANLQMYDGVEVISGTMVGCITRLDAIRATKPFAIVVEEASEVLEPLLFSCLTSTTCKLEMIGDHLQLRPSMMTKFDFEIINKMNISMFERLIRAPKTSAVPSSVLSIQRRMRKNICDLTRGFYNDITTINDHTICDTRVIAQGSNGKKALAVHRSEGAGREVPGVLPHLFFWTHTGQQGRSSVGISRENRHEAEMAVKLAEYLVSCGVPKESIAVLTPYKGQLMLLKKMLEKAKVYSYHGPNTCRISTVDRFQGDEADIVIISLVIDGKSRTPFLQLENRMIVLLSRARYKFQ